MNRERLCLIEQNASNDTLSEDLEDALHTRNRVEHRDMPPDDCPASYTRADVDSLVVKLNQEPTN